MNLVTKIKYGFDIKEVLKNLSQTIGRIIRRYRLKRKLSSHALAELAQISQGYISEIERGKYDPSIKTLMQIAAALKVPMWKIVKEAEEELAKED